MSRLIVADREALAALVDVYSLEEVLRELSSIWDERSEALRPGTEEWSATMVKRAIVDEVADEVAAVVNDARIRLRVLVRESADIATEVHL